jgi:hypothetical protein
MKRQASELAVQERAREALIDNRLLLTVVLDNRPNFYLFESYSAVGGRLFVERIRQRDATASALVHSGILTMCPDFLKRSTAADRAIVQQYTDLAPDQLGYVTRVEPRHIYLLGLIQNVAVVDEDEEQDSESTEDSVSISLSEEHK